MGGGECVVVGLVARVMHRRKRTVDLPATNTEDV